MKKAFVYVRVSTDEQAKEGFSIDNQIRACTDYARNFECEVKKVFSDEGKSARTTDRPAFKEMISAIESGGVESLIIYKIDRLARNVNDFTGILNKFKKQGISVISVLEGDLTNGSSLVANIYASVAQWESEVNGSRTRDALMQKFRGGWQPTPPPIGYRSVGGDRERKSCEPDPYSSPIIRQLFELYSTGNYSIFALQNWLSSQNLLSRFGRPLSCSVIDNILRNPFYYGLIRWHGEEKIGLHEPLISPSLFNTCQYVLAKHRSFLTRKRKNNFLLRGFIFCSECGQRYTAEWHHKPINLKKRGGYIAYYHCQKRGRNQCPSCYIEKEELEVKVENLMKTLQFSKEFLDLVVEKTKQRLNVTRENTGSQKIALFNTRTSYETKRNKLEDALLDGLLDRETYKRKHDELQTLISNVDEQVRRLEDNATLDMKLIEEVLSFTRDIHKTYVDAPEFLRRYYLRFFYEKIYVSGKNVDKVVKTPLFEELLRTNQVIVRDIQLPL